MIISLISAIVVSSLIVASIGYSYTKRDAESRISLEEVNMNPLDVYLIHPCIFLWSLVVEVFTWTKIGIMMFLSLEYRESVLDEEFMFIDEDEEK